MGSVRKKAGEELKSKWIKIVEAFKFVQKNRMQGAVKAFAEVEKDRASELGRVHSRENAVGEFNDSSSSRMIRSKARLEGVEEVMGGKMRLKLQINMSFEDFAEDARNRDRTKFIQLIREALFRDRNDSGRLENEGEDTRSNAGVVERGKVHAEGG